VPVTGVVDGLGLALVLAAAAEVAGVLGEADLLLELHAVPISATAAIAATVAVLAYRVVTVVPYL
jgi:hypothetical protein